MNNTTCFAHTQSASFTKFSDHHARTMGSAVILLGLNDPNESPSKVLTLDNATYTIPVENAFARCISTLSRVMPIVEGKKYNLVEENSQ